MTNAIKGNPGFRIRLQHAFAMNEIAPLDPEYVQDVLSKPPFVNLPGVFNVRDLGNLPSAIYEGYITKPRFIFRSAELSSITQEGELLSNQL